MKSSDIRKAFLDYFAGHGHAVVASSPLVPGNDPTLLFTNSGMVQFKDVFLGHEKRSYVRATTAQRCVRAGGKHNDLENVGYTARHHTFFEMLGNFSFGDYFKRDAIRYAWELLTKVYGLDSNRMWTTVYHEDDEAYDIWTREIGVPRERCVRIGDKPGAPKYQSDNFWQMADTGPCGPCSEIFWDHGPHIPGGPPGSKNADGDRYVEIWNLVFMQFNRDEAGTMVPLPKPSVDTGMGLERIAAALQKVHSNYEIDLFQDLIKAAARETHSKDYSSNSLKVVADHIRACSFLIVDGVIPSNEGRGYVLRRIIRRAIRHGYKLGQTDPFFHRIVGDLTRAMGEAYPELPRSADRVSQVLRQEEERFAETLANGMKVLEGALNREDRMLDGETVFQLYDTFGFPVDLTADIARERDVRVDYAGFEAAMERQRERARAASKFSAAANLEYRGAATEFHGYDALQLEAKVIALYDAEGVQAQEIAAGSSGIVVLDRTPFYAESGGQVGDRGELAGVNGTFEVQDTQKIQSAVFGHKGILRTGKLKVEDKVLAAVDTERRARTVRNHSATHLMHKALREVLGNHVQQKGSLVDPERTRFDFSHNEPLTDEQIRKVEAIVNAEILANAATTARIMKFDEAAKAGALAFFGDKYGDEVRVLDIGTSRELCGGTHVKRTGDIGFFKVISEGGIAAGVRRIEATTGEGALAWVQAMEKGVSELASEAGFREKNLAGVRQRLASLQEANRALEKELARLKSKMASSRGDELVEQAVAVKGVKVVAAAIEGADAKALREAVDKLKDKLKSAAVVLATANDGKVSLIAGVTADISGKVKAGDLVNHVAQQVGGKGGGRADMAQAGGNDPSKLPQALASVRAWVEQHL
jgi:alanyl-tRNA synthetase